MISEQVVPSTMPTPQNRRPSFHRRILPWIYIIAFLAIAPAVIFYTSGYRYNAKKGKIERFSTLIVDSTPTGASLFLDGQDTKDTTPSTLQTVTPGSHSVTISKDGYHTWFKNLEMSAQLATFASDVWLWKTSEPAIRFPEAAQAITASPDGTTLVRLISGTSTTIFASDPLGTSNIPFTIAQSIVSPTRWFWSADSKRLLLESSTSTWLIDLQSRQSPLLLPAGTYRWTQNAVSGTNEIKRSVITMPDLAMSQTTLPNSVFDMNENGDEIRATTGTTNRIFVSHTKPLQGLVLPQGNWTFWQTTADAALFRDAAHWLSVQYASKNPNSFSLSSETLHLIPGTNDQPYLGVDGGELWTWNPTEDPQLIYRRSDRIIDATWHHAGHDVFFATSQHVYALNLDPRDGRIQTNLATFDDITGLTVAGKELFIAGTKNSQTGVWALKVE